MPDEQNRLLMAVFNEIAILEQLSRALLEARLPKGFLGTHFGVLNHLMRLRDGQTPLDLSRAFQVPKTTMTHTLAALERAGLVTMAPNAQDGRSKRVWLTDRGRSFRNTAIADLTPDLSRIAARLSGDRIAAALPVLIDLRRVMDADRSGLRHAEDAMPAVHPDALD